MSVEFGDVADFITGIDLSRKADREYVKNELSNQPRVVMFDLSRVEKTSFSEDHHSSNIRDLNHVKWVYNFAQVQANQGRGYVIA